MWTPAARAHHGRDPLLSTTCLFDREWALVEPHLPPPARTGRPRRWPLRHVVTAILYVLRAGCAWPFLPVGQFAARPFGSRPGGPFTGGSAACWRTARETG